MNDPGKWLVSTAEGDRLTLSTAHAIAGGTKHVVEVDETQQDRGRFYEEAEVTVTPVGDSEVERFEIRSRLIGTGWSIPRIAGHYADSTTTPSTVVYKVAEGGEVDRGSLEATECPDCGRDVHHFGDLPSVMCLCGQSVEVTT